MLTRTRIATTLGALALTATLPMLPGHPTTTTASAAPVATASTSAHTSASTRSTHTSRGTSMRRKVLSTGNSLKGVPYVYGGDSPHGFDCSGYTQYVYGKAGADLPRTASAQRAATSHISRSDAAPGDLVFFHNSSGQVYHVGIYTGHNTVLHAPHSGSHVKTEKIWTSHVSFGRP